MDDTIVFRQLTAEDIRQIATRMLGGLNKRVQELDLTLSVSDEAVAQLAAVGFDPVYGARPLRRAIQNKVEDPLAEKLLEGQFKAGQTIVVTLEDGQFVFAVDKPETID